MSDENTVKAQSETLSFETEVSDLLRLVTHSLYSNSEIFLRELISNSSDAADRLRFLALSDAALFEKDSDLGVWVDVDKDARTITIRDNGLGMSREDMIEHLGTIAKSGTKSFIESLTGDQAKDSQLIGQFGVGFYSAFVVADTVVVRSRRAGMNASQGAEWKSNGKGEYSIQNVECPRRGTEIVLYIKEDQDEYLDPYRLRSIITKYSDHILLPIHMLKTEGTAPEKEGEEVDKKEEKAPEYEVVNRAKALWSLPKSEISETDYQELYKHISHDYEDPLAWSHNKVEGKLEYTTLLYLPKQAPFDLYNRDFQRGLKLYVRKVFIMDDAEQLLPMYLRFVKGVVDSNDLPLNVSREILQNNRVIASIRSGCVKRILSTLESMADKEPQKYAEFWSAFGEVLKEGPAEDFANRERIAKLLRFASTQVDNKEHTVSLTDYVSRMKPDQDKIYYLIGDSYHSAKNSPLLELLRKKDLEVLLLSDRVDEWLMSHLKEFEGKTFQSVGKGDLGLNDDETEEQKKEKEEQEKSFADVLKQVKESLGGRIKEVRLTDRLTDSPACVVFDDSDLSGHMQRMLNAAGQAFDTAKPILELNAKHQLVSQLKDVQDDVRFADWSEILLSQALLAEGEQLEDPSGFVKRLNDLLQKVN